MGPKRALKVLMSYWDLQDNNINRAYVRYLLLITSLDADDGVSSLRMLVYNTDLVGLPVSQDHYAGTALVHYFATARIKNSSAIQHAHLPTRY